MSKVPPYNPRVVVPVNRSTYDKVSKMRRAKDGAAVFLHAEQDGVVV